ncbi:MAG: hypothetical protein GXP54_02795 [Deltaproteobacteria bacterium]|nr:hypothetical protein [Deltaproteobacteria bacterium]
MIRHSRLGFCAGMLPILVLSCSGVGGTAGISDVLDAGVDAPETQVYQDAADVVADSVVSGCEGWAPMCASICGSDAFVGQAVCINDKWVCEKGILIDDCPPNTCWGPPAPGEVCGPNAWECRPDQTGAYAACPSLICYDCFGFEGPVTKNGCRCACDGANVRCKQVPDCVTGADSNLPGVSIRFAADRCSWTLAEAAAGIEIPYSVVVDDDFQDVFPMPQDAGQCGQPGTSGLILFEKLAGGDQSYCICDTGLCMGPDNKPVTLKKGEYAGVFQWDGVNWAGPSDTGNPKGQPFPPGTYTLTVSAVGSTDNPEGPAFKVEGTLEIQLTAE